MGLDNYIPDQNRFKLAAPPDWWLRLLKDYDPSLYVVPSRQGFYYRLAQKRRLTLPAKMVNDLMAEHGDTAMLASYSLIPVTTIRADATWSPLMFEALTARAPWRQGGAQKVIKRIEEAEAEADAKKDARVDDMLTQRSKDGYKLYKTLTGQRTFVNSSKVKNWQKTPDRAPMAGYKVTDSGLFVPNL